MNNISNKHRRKGMTMKLNPEITEYRFKLQHDNGTINMSVLASSEQSAIKMIMAGK